MRYPTSDEYDQDYHAEPSELANWDLAYEMDLRSGDVLCREDGNEPLRVRRIDGAGESVYLENMTATDENAVWQEPLVKLYEWWRQGYIVPAEVNYEPAEPGEEAAPEFSEEA